MFKIDWSIVWECLKVEAIDDRRLDPSRDRKDVCLYLTRKTRNDYNPVALIYLEQETIGI